MNDAYDYAASAVTMLQVAKMIYDTGRQDILNHRLNSFSFDCDEDYAFALEGIDELCDLFSHSCTDETGSMYFSSENMMEYYRLCRDYSKLKGIALKDNPYMLRAREDFREQMSEPGCYYCESWLQTKINHKWASGVVFKYDASYFYEFLNLFSRLLYVFEYYDCEVKTLRFEVWKLRCQRQSNVIMLPLPREERSAA